MPDHCQRAGDAVCMELRAGLRRPGMTGDPSMTSLAKVAFVTGGAQGIGRAIAERFLQDDLSVVIADSDAEAGQDAAARLADIGPVRFVQTDVADEAQVRQAVQAAIETFGHLDILVNNAGIGHSAPLAELSLAEWNRVIGVNLTGAFLCAQHAVPWLQASGGAIVNIASTRALMSEPHSEAYAASKGGLVALTHALAVSLGPKVRVNCISPGWIDVSEWKKAGVAKPAVLTEADHRQHPVGRVGTPADVAGLVAYLVSPEAGFITGENFVIDGGMTHKMIYV
jgi:NAD(P)-dependent dehydrogenase (short-subunit alcohol dehydrogenase family)